MYVARPIRGLGGIGKKNSLKFREEKTKKRGKTKKKTRPIGGLGGTQPLVVKRLKEDPDSARGGQVLSLLALLMQKYKY